MKIGLTTSGTDKTCFPLFCQSVVNSVTAEYNREQLWLANESFVTQLQARIRGHLARKKHLQRMEYLRQQEPHVVKIQVIKFQKVEHELFLLSSFNIVKSSWTSWWSSHFSLCAVQFATGEDVIRMSLCYCVEGNTSAIIPSGIRFSNFFCGWNDHTTEKNLLQSLFGSRLYCCLVSFFASDHKIQTHEVFRLFCGQLQI